MTYNVSPHHLRALTLAVTLSCLASGNAVAAPYFAENPALAGNTPGWGAIGSNGASSSSGNEGMISWQGNPGQTASAEMPTARSNPQPASAWHAGYVPWSTSSSPYGANAQMQIPPHTEPVAYVPPPPGPYPVSPRGAMDAMPYPGWGVRPVPYPMVPHWTGPRPEAYGPPPRGPYPPLPEMNGRAPYPIAMPPVPDYGPPPEGPYPPMPEMLGNSGNAWPGPTAAAPQPMPYGTPPVYGPGPAYGPWRGYGGPGNGSFGSWNMGSFNMRFPHGGPMNFAAGPWNGWGRPWSGGNDGASPWSSWNNGGTPWSAWDGGGSPWSSWSRPWGGSPWGGSAWSGWGGPMPPWGPMSPMGWW